jgi:DNA-binding MarR family transcriptional regulator
MNDQSVETEWRRHDISEIGNSMRLLQGVNQRQSRGFIQKYRITDQQLGALRIVGLSPGISLRQPSERLYLHTSTVSGIVDCLEKKGYVWRQRSDKDRRIVPQNVTPNGRRVIRRTPLASMGLLIHTIDPTAGRAIS